MEFLQANWLWIVLGLGAVWLVFGRGGWGAPPVGTARMARGHRGKLSGPPMLMVPPMARAPGSRRSARRRPQPLAGMGAAEGAGNGRLMTRSRGLLLGVLVIAASLALAGAGGAGAAPAAAPARSTPETQKVPIEGGGSYTDVNAAGLAALLERKDFPLVNVHVPYEGEIEGTDLFIAFNQVEANQAKLPADKSRKLVLYCRSGGMSAIAARALVKLGYTDVWNLDGGMIAWRQAGHPVVRKGR